jgi:hypothetical protein
MNIWMQNYGLIYTHMDLGGQIFRHPTESGINTMEILTLVFRIQNLLLKEILISEKTKAFLLPGLIVWIAKLDRVLVLALT